jgi:hypothetical protein
MGNDGSGWSMSVWPRRVVKEGQDRKYYRAGKLKLQQRFLGQSTKQRKPSDTRSDAEKLEAGLTKAIGARAAKRYIRRKKRKEAAP